MVDLWMDVIKQRGDAGTSVSLVQINISAVMNDELSAHCSSCSGSAFTDSEICSVYNMLDLLETAVELKSTEVFVMFAQVL